MPNIHDPLKALNGGRSRRSRKKGAVASTNAASSKNDVKVPSTAKKPSSTTAAIGEDLLDFLTEDQNNKVKEKKPRSNRDVIKVRKGTKRQNIAIANGGSAKLPAKTKKKGAAKSTTAAAFVTTAQMSTQEKQASLEEKEDTPTLSTSEESKKNLRSIAFDTRYINTEEGCRQNEAFLKECCSFLQALDRRDLLPAYFSCTELHRPVTKNKAARPTDRAILRVRTESCSSSLVSGIGTGNMHDILLSSVASQNIQPPPQNSNDANNQSPVKVPRSLSGRESWKLFADFVDSILQKGKNASSSSSSSPKIYEPQDIVIITNDISFLADTNEESHTRGIDEFWERVKPYFLKSELRRLQIVVATTNSVIVVGDESEKNNDANLEVHTEKSVIKHVDFDDKQTKIPVTAVHDEEAGKTKSPSFEYGGNSVDEQVDMEIKQVGSSVIDATEASEKSNDTNFEDVGNSVIERVDTNTKQIEGIAADDGAETSNEMAAKEELESESKQIEGGDPMVELPKPTKLETPPDELPKPNPAVLAPEIDPLAVQFKAVQIDGVARRKAPDVLSEEVAPMIESNTPEGCSGVDGEPKPPAVFPKLDPADEGLVQQRESLQECLSVLQQHLAEKAESDFITNRSYIQFGAKVIPSVNVSIVAIDSTYLGFTSLLREWTRETIPGSYQIAIELPETSDFDGCSLDLEAMYKIMPFSPTSPSAKKAVQDLTRLSLAKLEVQKMVPIVSIDASLLYGIPIEVRPALENGLTQHNQMKDLAQALFRLMSERDCALLLKVGALNDTEISKEGLFNSGEEQFLLMAEEPPSTILGQTAPTSGVLYRVANAEVWIAGTDIDDINAPDDSVSDDELYEYMTSSIGCLDCSPINPLYMSNKRGLNALVAIAKTEKGLVENYFGDPSGEQRRLEPTIDSKTGGDSSSVATANSPSEFKRNAPNPREPGLDSNNVWNDNTGVGSTVRLNEDADEETKSKKTIEAETPTQVFNHGLYDTSSDDESVCTRKALGTRRKAPSIINNDARKRMTTKLVSAQIAQKDDESDEGKWSDDLADYCGSDSDSTLPLP